MGARIPIYVPALRLRRSEPVVSDTCCLSMEKKAPVEVSFARESRLKHI